MIRLNGLPVTPTIFPDKTSQVWKVDFIERADERKVQEISWEFENEAELIQVLQLQQLCAIEGFMTELKMPYLPYGRQDKDVSNSTTFALHTFVRVLGNSDFYSVEVLDAHNPDVLPRWMTNVIPNDIIANVIEKVRPNAICFPDAGAAKRGYEIGELPYFSLAKKRNQQTGEIEGLESKLPLDLAGMNILMIDDICDGGRTFIEAAKVLYNLRCKNVSLYTTHGIYSKGIGVLKEAGIKGIFNYKGEV